MIGDCKVLISSDSPPKVLKSEGDQILTQCGCCKITVTDIVISGTLTICDTSITFPDLPPMSCVDTSGDNCPSCNSGVGCTASRIIETTGPYLICPGDTALTGFVSVGVGIQCQGDGFGWAVRATVGGSVNCACAEDPVIFTNTWEQIVMDPEDLAGTYPVSGDFTDFGQPGLTWSGTLVIERKADPCRCPCRFMTVAASCAYTDCFGFSGTITIPTVTIDWELAYCCGQGGLVSTGDCFQEPDHSFRACWDISRPGNCNFVDNPWNLATSCIDPVCSCGHGTTQDIPTPPDGTYVITDDTGHLTYTVTISCSDTAP